MAFVAATLYLAQAQFYWVGSSNDDALNILLSQSLWQGSYRALHIPGLPFVTTYPPLFPVVLMPFVKYFDPHWDQLKIVPITLTLCSSAVFWKLAQSLLRPPFRWMAFALFAFNPYIVLQSSFVMSSSIFLLMVVACYALLNSMLARTQKRDAWILGVLLGSAVLARSVGMILLPIFFCVLFFAGRKRDCVITAVTTLLVGSLFAIRNYFLTSTLSGYTANWSLSVQALLSPASFVDHLNRITNLFFVRAFLGVPLPYSPTGILLSLLLTMIVWFLMASSLYKLDSTKRSSRAMILSLFVGLVFFFAMHSLWRTLEIHYAVPLMPLIALLASLGLQNLGERAALPRRWQTGGCIALSLLMLSSGIQAIRHSREKWNDPASVFPGETWTWINAHLPPEARLQNALDALVFLYTRRTTLQLFYCTSREEYHRLLKENLVTHVLTRPVLIQRPGIDVGAMWRKNQEWISSDPKAYRQIYSNAAEATTIWQVL